MKEKIAVIGLGYVGLPVALAFAEKFPGTIGFDINTRRIDELSKGYDRTGESTAAELSSSIVFTADAELLREATFFVIAVPTPIDKANRPDLTPVRKASEFVGRVIQPGAVVVYESTVYPGVTEDICGPILESVSGLKQGVDFKLGYSPERINPGDKEHTLQRIVKVVSGEDAATLDRVATTYGAIIDAGVHRASSIMVAEAAKVIENTQRDLNIALMNELSRIFDLMGISTKDVLAAAGTKWNFLNFTPGLVGGHCIGVDPYYLTTRAEELGYQPEVILAGRRINDGMGAFVARKAVQFLAKSGVHLKNARVGVFGVTFKEDVPDIRNSRVPDIVFELQAYGITPMLHDPMVDAEEFHHEYKLQLSTEENMADLDMVIFAVPHHHYDKNDIISRLKPGGIMIDVKSVFDRATLPASVSYWSL